MAPAAAKVEASGAVGPEPMTSTSSPMTSESSRDSTRAGAARRASCPPLMSEMCLRTVLISWMVAALVQLDAAQFGDVAVLDIDQAGGDLAAEDTFGGLRHGGSRLACADHVDMAEAGEVAAFQVAGDGAGRVGGGERGAEDGQGVAAESSGGHGEIREGDCGFNAET